MTSLERRARDLALYLHRGQVYGLVHPYSFHLAAVVGVLARFYQDEPAVRAAAWLHDVVEDTPATLDDVWRTLTGLNYAGIPPSLASVNDTLDLVRAVTDPKDPDGRRLTRREKLPRVVAQIRAAGVNAVVLKLADRIANVEASLLGGKSSGLFRMYAAEHTVFRDGLYRPDEADAMWFHLDKLLADDGGVA